MAKTKTEKKERVYSPKAVLSELKAVKWAHFKSNGKDIGTGRTFLTTVLFIAIFTGFFELCSLITATLLHLGGN